MTEIIKLETLSDLSEYEPDSVDLVPEYWSPSEQHETRKLYYYKCGVQPVSDFNDETKTVELRCAIFVDPSGPTTVVNGSKRLVAAVENLTEGTPVQITYLGREKNKTNSNQSDRWKVTTLAKKGGE